MFNKLLVPLDGSRFASRALPYAIDIALRYDIEIILLQVIQQTTPITESGIEYGIESPISAEIAVETALTEDKRHSAYAKRYLSAQVRKIKGKGVRVSYQTIFGQPVQTILKFIRRHKIDIVVMTTHGKTGFRRAIMGSVADAVIRESSIPVLVVRPRSRGK